MAPVKAAQVIQLPPLLRIADFIRRIQVGNRFGPGREACALIKCRHKPGTPIARTIYHGGVIVLHDHKRGEVLIVRAETVRNPGPQRGAARQDGASIHLANTGGMVYPVRPAGTDHGHVIHALGKMRQPVRDPNPALPILLPCALAGEQR